MDDLALYNETDNFAADWLENLIRAGEIAPGRVDRRSILDLTPDDVLPYRQVHFFAGIGLWSAACRAAGIRDDQPVWTGSCPCQPFSQAGKGGGVTDERHLWPAFHWLIEQCRPAIVVGEQVAGRHGDAWLDLVSADMEAKGYAFGAVETVACGFGAPNERSRNYWVAYSDSEGRDRLDALLRPETEGRLGTPAFPETAGRGEFSQLAHLNGEGLALGSSHAHKQGIVRNEGNAPGANGLFDGVADDRRAAPVNGFWADADWLYCRDGKWRPVEPGTFPLAHGMPRGMGNLGPELRRLAEVAGLSNKSLARAKAHRIGSLRGYGNAINFEQAVEFIRAAYPMKQAAE